MNISRQLLIATLSAALEQIKQGEAIASQSNINNQRSPLHLPTQSDRLQPNSKN